MKVSEIAERLGLEIYTAKEAACTIDVKGCYIGDLLSLAMSKVEINNVWITIQTNVNVVAIAALTDAACILLADGFSPDENTVKKANEQDVVILGGDISAYDAAVKLSEFGI
jgi:predicted transcriptional regulator